MNWSSLLKPLVERNRANSSKGPEGPAASENRGVVGSIPTLAIHFLPAIEHIP
jgi:hypothetical protein